MDGRRETDISPSERAVVGGMAHVLKHIQRGMPLGDIKPLVQGLQQHGDAFLDSREFAGQNGKVRANVLIAHTIGKIWSPMMAFTHTQQNKMELPVGSLRHPVTPDLVEETMKKSPKEGFAVLAAFTNTLCQHYVTEWEATDHSRVRQELTAIFEGGYRRSSQSADVLLMRGFKTAQNTVWGLINSMDTEYKRAYGSAPTPEKFRELAKSARALAIDLATARLDVFVNIIRPAITPEVDGFSDPLMIQGLMLSEKNGREKIAFTPAKLKEIMRNASDVDNMTPRTLCPALHVFGPSGDHIIGEYFDWAMALVEKYYFPTLADTR